VPGLGIVVDLEPEYGVLALKYLRVPFGYRWPGVAAGIVLRLLAWCDRTGVDIAVTPTGEYGSDKRRLVLALTPVRVRAVRLAHHRAHDAAPGAGKARRRRRPPHARTDRKISTLLTPVTGARRRPRQPVGTLPVMRAAV